MISKLTEIELNYLKLINRKDRMVILSEESYLFFNELLNLFKSEYTSDNVSNPFLMNDFFEAFHDLTFYDNRRNYLNTKNVLIELSKHKNFKMFFEIEFDSGQQTDTIFTLKEYFQYQDQDSQKELYSIYFKNKDFNDPNTVVECKRMLRRMENVQAIYSFFKDNDEILNSFLDDKLKDILGKHSSLVNMYYDYEDLRFLFKQSKNNVYRTTTAEVYGLLELYIKEGETEAFNDIFRIIDTEHIKKRLTRDKRLKMVQNVNKISISKGKRFEKAINHLFGISVPVDIDQHFITFHDLTISSQLFMLSIKENEGKINKLIRETITEDFYTENNSYIELKEEYRDFIVLNYKM